VEYVTGCEARLPLQGSSGKDYHQAEFFYLNNYHPFIHNKGFFPARLPSGKCVNNTTLCSIYVILVGFKRAIFDMY
jgi:hypothetical protein